MIRVEDKTKCCGCTACDNVCPKSAIEMVSDSEGFLYPQVNDNKCIQCGLCEKVCPILHKSHQKERTEGYIIRYKNEKVLQESTSGGAFSAFATYLINLGYIVYGAGYDNNMRVTCKMTSNTEGLVEMRGSKFVQSFLGNTFKNIKKQLEEGKKVLFSGTPCQVSGLINFLGGKHENLICIDFVCRGVPSPLIWKNYITMMEKKNKSKIISARFKHKTYGYHATTMRVEFSNGKIWYGSGRVDPMMKSFVTEMSSRPSCYNCSFKSVERQSDITLFDCYEFSKITGKKDDNKGYSSILVHTNLGHSILNAVKEYLEWYEEDVESLVKYNGIMMKNSAKPHAKRDYFFQLIQTQSIEEAINKITPITRRDRLIEKSKNYIYKKGLIEIIRKFRKQKTVKINNFK